MTHITTHLRSYSRRVSIVFILYLWGLFNFSNLSLAQAPHKMTFQTVIRNSNNEFVSNSKVSVRISILSDSVSGVSVYTETHSTVTNINGLATLEVGTGNVVKGTFIGIPWGKAQYFLKSEIDPNGGSNYSISGVSQLVSVPYALHSESVNTYISDIGDTLIIGNGDPIIIPGLSFSNSKLPTVVTTSPTTVISTRSIAGGIVTKQGKSKVLARGVVWHSDSMPTLKTNIGFTVDGLDTGRFISDIKWLKPKSTYKYRAYATNSYGTSYGEALTLTTNDSLQIGDKNQGGVIVYIKKKGDKGYDTSVMHGLVIAEIDTIGFSWGCGIYVGARANGIGQGSINTKMIVDSCKPVKYAAHFCYDLVHNGYDDWYLPSSSEVDLFYYPMASKGLFKIKGNGNYWTSNEHGAGHAYSVPNFGGQVKYYDFFQVVPMREF